MADLATGRMNPSVRACPSRGLRRLHARLLRQSAGLSGLAGAAAERLAVREDRVSAWSVGDHLEHMQRVGRSVLGVLDKLRAEPRPGPGPAIRPAGRLVLFLGVIPRGRARATKFVEPQGLPRESLQAELGALHARLAALGPEQLAALEGIEGRLPHPIFGGLDARQWLRFLEIHQHHHLKIVRDIERRRRRG
jgi:hypothetical protein